MTNREEKSVMAMGADEAQQSFYNLATQAEQYVRNGDHAEALLLFARIVASGDPDLGPHAALRIGALLADGDPSAAAASWRYTADNAFGEIGAAAHNNLRLLAEHTGAPVRTEPSSVAEVYGRATLGRGRLLLNAGDLQAAGQAFEEAVPCPHPDVAAEALVHLGATRAMQGEDSAALVTLERAVGSGHPHWAPLAAIDVAELSWDRGEHGHALELLRWVASTDHPTARASAVSRLEALGEGSSESAAAEAGPAAQPTATAADPDAGLVLIEAGADPGDDPERFGADAMLTGRRQLAQGDLTSALRTFEQAIDTGHPIHAPAGAAQVAHAFWQREGMSGAETAIGRLTDNGFPELEARGWFFLGKQLVAAGKFDEAEEALQKATDLPGDAQPAATCSLWILDADLSNAEETFGETLERTPDLATEVVGLAVDFGDVLRNQHDTQTSRLAYELAFHLAQRTGDDYLVAETRKLLTG